MAFQLYSKMVAYSWTVVLGRLIYVIKVVQCLFFSFQNSLPHLKFNWQAWYYCYSSIAYIPSHFSVEAICHGEGWFQSGNSSLHISECFNFETRQRWICWHSHIPISVSDITPKKIHYLWGLTLLSTLGHIR